MNSLSFKNWRVFVPVSVLLAALLSLYARFLIADIKETEQRYIEANAMLLDYLNQVENKEFRDCRLATRQDLNTQANLKEGDVLLLSADSGGEFFPLGSFVRELHKSRHRSDLEQLMREADLSLYALSTRSCAKWSRVLELYDARYRLKLGASKEL